MVVTSGLQAFPGASLRFLGKPTTYGGECSFYWPYLKTMHAAELRLPDLWSFEERSLLDGLPTPQDAQ